MAPKFARLALAATLASLSSPLAPAWSIPSISQILTPNPTSTQQIEQVPDTFTTSTTSNWHYLTPSIHPETGRQVSLWSTYYHIYQARDISQGYPLLDRNGRALAYLSHRDWCYAALQGTVQVEDRQGGRQTYNFAGRGATLQLDCSGYFKSLSPATLQKTGRVRFSPARGVHGDGAGGYRLVPYRTIAVDRNRIPLGSTVYIPAARGQRIVTPTGETFLHDGYFFAADVGSAIKGNHIDVFIGSSKRNPFPFITSKASGVFQAFIVRDPQVTQTLNAMHR